MALVVALMTMMLLLAYGTALALLTATDTRIAANFRDASSALYAADAALLLAVEDLGTRPDWAAILASSATSSFVDGAPTGARQTASGAIDLGIETNMARLARSGAPNPGWQLYAYGPLDTLMAADGAAPSEYVVVWIAADLVNGADGALVVQARAYGPGGVARAVEASISREAMLSWRDIR